MDDASVGHLLERVGHAHGLARGAEEGWHDGGESGIGDSPSEVGHLGGDAGDLVHDDDAGAASAAVQLPRHAVVFELLFGEVV